MMFLFAFEHKVLLMLHGYENFLFSFCAKNLHKNLFCCNLKIEKSKHKDFLVLFQQNTTFKKYMLTFHNENSFNFYAKTFD